MNPSKLQASTNSPLARVLRRGLFNLAKDGADSRQLAIQNNLKFSIVCSRKFGSFASDEPEEQAITSKSDLTSSQVYKKIFFKYIWPKGDLKTKSTVTSVVAMYFTSKAIETNLVLIYKKVIDLLSSSSELTPNIFSNCQYLLLSWGLLKVLSSVITQVAHYINSLVGFRAFKSIYTRSFKKIHNSSFEFNISKESGSAAKIIDRGSQAVENAVHHSISSILPTIFQISLGTGVLFTKLGLNYSLVGVSTITLYSIYTFLITQERIKIRKAMNISENKISAFTLDSLTNFEVVKIFQNQKLESNLLAQKILDFIRHSKRTSWTLGLMNGGQIAIFTTGLTTMLAMGVRGVANGSNSVGDLVLANGLMWQIYQPLFFLGMLYRQTSRSLVDMKSLLAYTDHEDKIKEKNETNLQNQSIIVSRKDFMNQPIVFENVSFKYKSKNHYLLKNISFTIPPHSKVAFVGKSGSGKTTIQRLLFRMIEPTEGSIYLGDRNYKDFDLDSWQKQISIVSQESQFFNRSVWDNIKYGDNESTSDQVINITSKTELFPLIMTLPEKFNTPVGERGTKFSGGERQRLNIARALLKNGSIQIFDEASASLDSITERSITGLLKASKSISTSIFIAHRLQTIKDCDMIYVLSGSDSMQSGTHTELLKDKQGLYYQLWKEQHSGQAME